MKQLFQSAAALLKTKEGKVLAGLGILAGLGLTFAGFAWYNSREREQVKDAIRDYLINNPKATGEQLYHQFNDSTK